MPSQATATVDRITAALDAAAAKIAARTAAAPDFVGIAAAMDTALATAIDTGAVTVTLVNATPVVDAVQLDDASEDALAAPFRGQLAPGARRAFVRAGRAVFTIVNPKSGNRFTYRVTAPDNATPERPVLFVSLLTGADSQYQYLGTLFGDTFRTTRKSRISADAPSAKAFAWFAENLESARVVVWHEGRCGKCGRALTVPESIASGLGPVCAGRE